MEQGYDRELMQHYIIMSKLGYSLDKIIKKRNRKYKTKTAVQIGI